MKRRPYKKRLEFLGILLLICTGLSVPTHASQALFKEATPTPTSKNFTFSINNTPVMTESELIVINNTLMVPIRDFSDQLNLNIRYLQKDDTYKLSFHHLKTTALLVPNSQEMWVNHKKQYLTQAPFEHNRRLYVPFLSTFQSLPITVQQVSTYNYTLEVLNKDIDSTRKADDIIRNIDNLALPELEPDRPLFLSFGDSVHDIQPHFKQKNGIVYINLAPFIKKEGFNISLTDSTFKISDKKHSISWAKGSRNVQFSASNEARPFFEPIVKNKTFFVPLPSLFVGLNRDLHWDPKTRTITLLNRINNIEVLTNQAKKPHKSSNNTNKQNQSKRETMTLKLFGEQHIEFEKPRLSFWGHGYYVKIPYTLSQLSTKKIQDINKTIQKKGTYVDHIQLNNHKNEYSELFIGFKDIKLYPYIKKQKDTLNISFLNTIQKVEAFENNKEAIIDIYMAETVKPSVSYLSNPQRMVLDFDGIVHNIPEIQRYNFRSFFRIRSSVNNVTNPRTRLVIDLNEDKSFKKPKYKVEQDGRRVSVYLSLPVETVTQKPISKPKPRSKSPGLKNKVIVLDAGHGGRDPGGVGPHQEFEKKYTLDITQRLKRRLEGAGAYVIEARKGDANPTLSDRVEIANKNKADALISVHINYFVNKNTQGTETYYFKYKDKALANAIHKEMAKTLKRPNRGVKRSRLYVLNHSKMPAALIEPMFITNPTELRLLKQESTRQDIADATFRGIEAYFK